MFTANSIYRDDDRIISHLLDDIRDLREALEVERKTVDEAEEDNNFLRNQLEEERTVNQEYAEELAEYRKQFDQFERILKSRTWEHWHVRSIEGTPESTVVTFSNGTHEVHATPEEIVSYGDLVRDVRDAIERMKGEK